MSTAENDPALSSPSPLAAKVQGALAPLLSGRGDAVPQVVDHLLAQAFEAGVSDLHVVSEEQSVGVLFRIDGALHRVMSLPGELREALLQRIKVMADLVVYQTRQPQDGRLDLAFDGRPVSLRAAFMPTLHGERCVIRFPDPARERFTCDELGMPDDQLDRFQALLDRPGGAVLLTGPASSGKTTTIYAALRWLVAHRGGDLNILSIEDPVEAEIPGVGQTQIDPGADLDYSRALRAALRQDPNVLVVGEVRDCETAATAMQAALTGHLVVATVHAGSSAGVFTRLAQMEVERYLLATCVSGVLNQRLARCICEGCRQPWKSETPVLEALGLTEGDYDTGVGCDLCHGAGLRGRIGAFELMGISAPLREAVLRGAPEAELNALAAEEGQPTLRDDLLFKVRLKIIPPREALRLLG